MGRVSTAPATPPPKRRRVWPWVVGGLLVFVVIAAIAIPNLLRSRMAAGESPVMGTLRGLNTAAVTYISTFANGFPPSLKALGPPLAGSAADCNHADLVPADWLSGQRYGYRFEYVPGPRVEKPGPGCALAGVESYQIRGRPIRYGETGTRSFYTDESAVIRSTVEDRAATADDPPIN